MIDYVVSIKAKSDLKCSNCQLRAFYDETNSVCMVTRVAISSPNKQPETCPAMTKEEFIMLNT